MKFRKKKSIEKSILQSTTFTISYTNLAFYVNPKKLLRMNVSILQRNSSISVLKEVNLRKSLGEREARMATSNKIRRTSYFFLLAVKEAFRNNESET